METHRGARIPSRTFFPDTPTILMITLLPTTISSFILRDRTSMVRIPLLLNGVVCGFGGRPGWQAPYPWLDGGRPHGGPQSLTQSIENQPAHHSPACADNKKTPVEEQGSSKGRSLPDHCRPS